MCFKGVEFAQLACLIYILGTFLFFLMCGIEVTDWTKESQNKISSELIQEYLENLNLSASLTSGNSLRFVDNESESNREPITVRVKSKLEEKLENSIQFHWESQRD